MAEPLTMVIVAAGIGGAAGKLVESAWDAGQKWLATRYQDHQQAALEKARENAGEFLVDLATRVKRLEESKTVTPERINSALSDPDFSVVLQKAMLGSSQTSSKEKHQLLARLVSERLQVSPESRLALVSKMACDTIPNLNSTQMRVLGLLAVIYYVHPATQLSPEQYVAFIVQKLQPFTDLAFVEMDMAHLEATSCIQISFGARDLGTALAASNRGAPFDAALFNKSTIGPVANKLWSTTRLKSASLTSLGILIGIGVCDQLTHSQTDISQF